MATSACQSPTEALRSFKLQGVEDTGKVIGEGAYGTVKELKFHGLKCVGKKIHTLLYNSATPQEKVAMLERFANECQLLSQLHHPCIVQYIGVYFEGGSDLPVLVMEYLHSTLAECLDKGIPPEEITYEILRDIILGLRYLHEHSPSITHRDLSANNVLLTPNMSAKISDLGVAKILNLNPARKSQIKPQTQTPGTPCYMPPETMVARPKYTTKVDIFSYGVMMVHMLSGQWPIPGEAFQEDPNNPNSIIGVSEFDRRAEFLQQIPQDHPLMGLIRRCLSNMSSHRPEAMFIHEEIGSILASITPTYLNRIELVHENSFLNEQVDMLRGSISQSNDENEALKAQVERLSIREENLSSGAGLTQSISMSLRRDSLNHKATGPQWEEFEGQWSICGNREFFVLSSIGKVPRGTPDIIPLQGKGQLSERDLQKLRSEGIPGHCRDDLSIVRARITLDPKCQLYREEVSTTGMELSRDYVIGQLGEFLNSVEQSSAYILYVGHGKKGTGDWCFKDGFITFRDILHLYNSTKIKGRVLAVISNCSYSGSWVKECCQYLDEERVTSCGHSAAKKGILLKVFASCKPSEMANTLVYSARGINNGKDKAMWFWANFNKEIHQSQHAFGINFTALHCGKAPHDPCTRRSPEYTWMKKYQGYRGLVQLVKGKAGSRTKWLYVVLRDDDEVIRVFKDKLASGNLDVADYGQILKSGWGEASTDEVKDKLDPYGSSYSGCS